MKLGIIGAGVIGKTHIKTAVDSPNFELVGVADPDPAPGRYPGNTGFRVIKPIQSCLRRRNRMR